MKVGVAPLRPPTLVMRNIYPRRCPNALRFLAFLLQTAHEPATLRCPQNFRSANASNSTISAERSRNSSSYLVVCGPGSSVGTATELPGWTVRDRIPVRRDFPPVQTGPGAHPASCRMGTGSFPGVKCGRGVLLTTHPLLVPRSWKSRAIPLPTLWATPGL